MIRLTVFYNLPEGADEAAFLKLRMGDMQTANETQAGVIRTDFTRLDERWTPEDLHAPTPYRFMTTADWADRASFEASFYTPENLAQLRADLHHVAPDYVMMIGEILIPGK